MREVTLPKSTDLDYKLAKALGLQIPTGPYEGLYKSLDGVNPTLFTSPPSFSGNADLLEKAVDKLLNLEAVSISTKQLVAELSEREGVDRVDIGYLMGTNLQNKQGEEITGPAIVLVITD